jgi:hypothetical protein
VVGPCIKALSVALQLPGRFTAKTHISVQSEVSVLASSNLLLYRFAQSSAQGIRNALIPFAIQSRRKAYAAVWFGNRFGEPTDVPGKTEKTLTFLRLWRS